ncbi:hypothetical protein FDUTEX481_08372 [Tolypothrix sp. PCC 7601]|nr:hypothetical protein FDUTEX481_08372 [Tolypothrix sp. PCC 7601]
MALSLIISRINYSKVMAWISSVFLRKRLEQIIVIISPTTYI